MVDSKDELAGVVAIVGVVSLALALAGLGALLDAAFGGGSVVVLTLESPGSTGAAEVVRAAGSGSSLAGGVLAAAGISGLLATYAAITSGYFDPDPEAEPEPAVEERETDPGAEPS
jgi:hypothetical protein